MKKTGFSSLLPFALLLVVLIVFLRLVVAGGTAPTPGIFDEQLTLQQAMQRADEQGTSVFVVATGASCPPCQAYKRTTLVDPDVVAVVRRMTPVHLDIEAFPDDARALGVTAIPTTFVIEDGLIRARAQGRLSSEALIEMITPYAAPSATIVTDADAD